MKRGTSHAWHDERLRAQAPPPERSGRVGELEVQGTADGQPFTTSGLIGYRAADTEARDETSLLWPIALVAGLGLVLLAALVPPLLIRREDEGAMEDAATEGSSGTP